MTTAQLKLDQSRALLARSDELIARGCQGHKRSHDALSEGYPVFATKAQGARFWDVDGNSYLDYLLGFGPILLGYNDPVVNEAVIRQMNEGLIYTVAHPKELEVAELISRTIPMAEMVAFFIGGSAATSGAIRLARAYTGREYIIRCGYHGWHDWTQPRGMGVPDRIGDLTLAVDYNDLGQIEDLFKKYDRRIACVIMESIQGEGPKEGFLQGLVDLCHQHGALAIFDEIKVGFRVAFGGATEYYNVKPDLATFGKACCNGFPGSFVAGRKEIIGSEKCQHAWLAATFHCDMPSLIALETVIAEVKRRNGIAYQWKIGKQLMDGINAACKETGLGYHLSGAAPMPKPNIHKEDRERVMKVLQGCLRRGHYLPPGHPMFLSLSHTEADINSTIKAFRESIEEI